MVFKIASCNEVPNIFVEMFSTSFYQNVSVRVAASFCWWCYISVFLLTFFSTFCLTPSSLLIQIKSVKTFQRKKNEISAHSFSSWMPETKLYCRCSILKGQINFFTLMGHDQFKHQTQHFFDLSFVLI
jgi:hypothetical protein